MTLVAVLAEHPVPVAVALVGLTVWVWHRLAASFGEPDVNDGLTPTLTDNEAEHIHAHIKRIA